MRSGRRLARREQDVTRRADRTQATDPGDGPSQGAAARGRSGRGRLRALALLATWLALPPSADAAPGDGASDGGARRQRQVLHERPPAAGGAKRGDRVVGVAGAGKLPGAIETASGTIRAPQTKGAGEAGGDDGAPIYPAPPPPGTTPPPKISPDAATGAEGALHYRVVFDPSVAPFKRDLAFDHADETGALRMSGADVEAVALRSDRGRAGHELFWGHVTLQLAAGRRTPLPSVAPDSAILGWQADPPLPLTFHRDGAGNFSVALGGARAEATVELRYLMDATSTYFAAPLGDGPVADGPPQRPLTPEIQAQIEALWPLLGVRRDQTPRANLEALTAWFRSFTPGAGPKPGPALLTEMITQRKGICRHRSHGFVLVAWSLGLRAHYVMNDAHAFVEVWAPGGDGRGFWLRVDLGGGAESLELHGAEDHTLHTPLFADSLPRPPAYMAQFGGQRLSDARPGAPSAGGPGTWAGAQQVIGADKFQKRQPDAAGQGGGAGGNADRSLGGNQGGSQGGGQGPQPDRAWLAERAATIAAPVRPPPSSASAEPPASDDGDRRAATVLTVDEAAPVAFVGEPLRVRGTLRALDGATDTKGRTLEVWLVDPKQPSASVRVGLVVTQGQGRFDGEIALPLDARLGVWDLVVRFPGDRSLQPAFSRDR